MYRVHRVSIRDLHLALMGQSPSCNYERQLDDRENIKNLKVAALTSEYPLLYVFTNFTVFYVLQGGKTILEAARGSDYTQCDNLTAYSLQIPLKKKVAK